MLLGGYGACETRNSTLRARKEGRRKQEKEGVSLSLTLVKNRERKGVKERFVGQSQRDFAACGIWIITNTARTRRDIPAK
jgi:hypothetical protein